MAINRASSSSSSSSASYSASNARHPHVTALGGTADPILEGRKGKGGGELLKGGIYLEGGKGSLSPPLLLLGHVTHVYHVHKGIKSILLRTGLEWTESGILDCPSFSFSSPLMAISAIDIGRKKRRRAATIGR